MAHKPLVVESARALRLPPPQRTRLSKRCSRKQTICSNDFSRMRAAHGFEKASSQAWTTSYLRGFGSRASAAAGGLCSMASADGLGVGADLGAALLARHNSFIHQSLRRLLAPKAGALPGCATPRPDEHLSIPGKFAPLTIPPDLAGRRHFAKTSPARRVLRTSLPSSLMTARVDDDAFLCCRLPSYYLGFPRTWLCRGWRWCAALRDCAQPASVQPPVTHTT